MIANALRSTLSDDGQFFVIAHTGGAIALMLVDPRVKVPRS
ncbi:hypothetical protein [Oscillatoria sp. FACHB-1407]|nr:hypothetical protein [Oscillatoria sp. FACHB-1407]